jgi:hypothetical protein
LLACGFEVAESLGFPELEAVADAEAPPEDVDEAEDDELADADALEDAALGLGDRLGA